ncbi:unnamed protein product [Rotaria sp. Silwood1]|nr:unnamed protein product [Rotaria sp. Silwood1]
MGCLFSFFFRPTASADIVETPRQVFSWEKEDRQAIRKEDFILDKLKNETIYRLSGSINGQQFIVQNCDNCTVYVFDHTGQIQIDDCTNCRILIGPVHGSVFIRDSTNCILATVCQQFRTRDCRDLYVYLSCTSQPIIESSHNIKFGCLTLNYDKLAEQYKLADINPWNNTWGNIHDFTTIPGGNNYSLLDQNENLFKHLPIPIDPSCSHMNINDNMETSVTPFTYGELYRHRNEERCLVVFFQNSNADSCARELILMAKQSEIVLVQTKYFLINEMSASRLFSGNTTYNSLVTKGPVIGLEFAGTNCIQICQQLLNNLIKLKYQNLSHFISQSATDANEQLQKFYNFANNERMTATGVSSIDKNASPGDQQRLNEGNGNDYEDKIVQEFSHLLEKSKQLFNGLRDLPQYGHKQWQPYFGRTFDVYTKLWKFQQQHRVLLDKKYNLKRWQIGEIASKIGQLYYHFYIRTSETNYLNEAFAFYSAIRTRAYYSKVNREEKPDLMVKKLRYYARFIVVCLLLKKTKIMRELVCELNRQIDEYVKAYDPDDSLEWQLVLNEISTFIDVDNQLNIDHIPITLSYRLNNSLVPPLPIGSEKILSNIQLYTVEEILIIGNYQDQIKFSELTIDMYRMLQAVEKQSIESTLSYDEKTTVQSPTSINHQQRDIYNFHDGDFQHRPNPHKYLLYKPNFSQIYAFTASAFKELPNHGILLLYISADGYDTHLKSKIEQSYDFGGVKTNNRRDDTIENSNSPPTSTTNTLGKKSPPSSSTITTTTTTIGSIKDIHNIFPGDLYPFLRKPLFLIIDSNNSIAFQNMPNLFGQPFVSLLSPIKLPTVFHDYQNKGSLFTLFLTSPIYAFCFVCHLNDLTNEQWNLCQEHINKIIFEITKLFLKSKLVDSTIYHFFADEFLRLFLSRFVFCYAVLRLHRAFKGSGFYPSSQPQLSNDLLENVQIHKMILELSAVLNVRQLFLEGPLTTTDLISSNQ